MIVRVFQQFYYRIILFLHPSSCKASRPPPPTTLAHFPANSPRAASTSEYGIYCYILNFRYILSAAPKKGKKRKQARQEKKKEKKARKHKDKAGKHKDKAESSSSDTEEEAAE